nr:hypothetical protein [Tanacetum cinerariifolium]
MSQFVQISHTPQYVVPFHTKKLFTTLRVNSPSFSGRIVPLFDTMLIQQGEGSGTPTEPHHTPSLEEVEIIRLKERVKVLKDKDGVIGDKSVDDGPIKGRSSYEGEAPTERISNDSEEIARVLTSMDAATVLAGEANVSTGSEVGSTASPIVRRRKGKEILVESDTPKKKKLQEQIDT